MQYRKPSTAEKRHRLGPWRVCEPSASIDPATQADAAFFRRFPDRTVRMRPASQLEVQGIVKNAPAMPAMPDGWGWFTLSHRFPFGQHDQQYMMAPADSDCDLSEEKARAQWEFGCPPGSEVDRSMSVTRHMADGGGGIGFCFTVGRDAGTYPDTEAAIEAVDDFVEVTGLQQPLVVASIDGIHAVWPLVDGLPREGLFYAMVLGRLADHHKLRFDGYVVAEPGL